MPTVTTSLPRRVHLELQSPAEKAIRDAVAVVESMPADERLTNAVTLLDEARETVADYVDEHPEIGTAPQSGWRPIDTAPKDGTFIILGAPSGYTTTPVRAHVGRWDTTYDVDRWIIHSNDDFTDDGCPPTHWMPLPAPPTEDATG